MVGMADAVALAEQGGIDVDRMLEMVGSGMGSSRAITDLAPKAVAKDWRPGFLNEHMRKDLTLALTQAEDLEITLPGTDTAYTLYDLLCEIGGSRLGTQAIALLYAEEGDAVAAGLDWHALDEDEEEEHECCHHHDHEHGEGCCHGHGHGHGHGEGGCCHGHGHGHGEDGCCHHHDEARS